MKVLFAIDRFLGRFESGLLVSFLFIMVVLSALQILLRNVFNTGVSWADIFLRHLVLWVGFLGASLATLEGRHINVDALSRIIPPRPRRLVEMVINLFSCGICVLLAEAAVDFVRLEYGDHINLFLSVQTWIAELIMPAALAIIAFRFLVKAIESCAAFVKGEGE